MYKNLNQALSALFAFPFYNCSVQYFGKSYSHKVVLLCMTLFLTLFSISISSAQTSGYADSGSGLYKSYINWLTWSGTDLDDGIDNGDEVVFPLLCRNGTLTVTFSNVVGTPQTAYIPNDMQTWSGASVHNLYNISGNSGEALYGDIGYNNSWSFRVTFNMVIDGQTVNPDIIFVDAETSDNYGESRQVITNGSGWRVIENAVGSNYNVTGFGNTTLTMTRTESPSHSPICLTENATQLDITESNTNPGLGGPQAIAFGVLLPCDHGDAPGYGDPTHSFEVEAANPPGTPASPSGLDNASGQVYIGSLTPDAETALSANDNAQGLRPADEDGIVFNNSLETTTISYTIPVSDITVNTGSSAATLHAWIDFDANGVFEDDEYHSTTVPANTTNGNPNNDLVWNSANGNAPGGMSEGITYGRFRLTTDNLTDTDGSNTDSRATVQTVTQAIDGEVEDYPISVTAPVCSWGFVEGPGGTKSGNADSQTNFNVTGAANALGAPNGSLAYINSTDVLVLDLTDTVPEGEDIILRMAAYANGPINVQASDDNSTWSATTSINVSGTTLANYTYTVPTGFDARYLRFTVSGGADLDFDAVSYSFTTVTCFVDSDNDGVANTDDIDDDNDGIPDVKEICGASATDFSCLTGCTNCDPAADDDSDGTPNYQDSDYCTLNANGVCDNLDADGDGIINSLDLDADNDGIPDIIEAGGIDTNGDGYVDYPTAGDPKSMIDLDGDGLADPYDDTDTAGGTPGWSAGTPIPNLNTDGDGLDDFLDLDADNDGIPDLVEAGGIDSNGDGLVDGLNPDGTLAADNDNDGFTDNFDPDNDGTPGVDAGSDTQPLVETDGSGNLLNGETGTSLDTDGDGLPDHLDLDADNDGIPDLVEAGGVDSNGDGLVDTPTDADGDGFADVYDTDDDGTAGVEDAADALLQTDGTDTDGDGKADDAAIVYENGENVNADSDGDGLPDHLDLDADNDGIPDLVEAGGVDSNGDGLVDTPTDADGDGFADVYDTDDDGTAGVEDAADALLQTDGTDTDGDGKADDAAIVYENGENVNADSDGDGLPDHLDLDADNDGIPDLVEAGGVDSNGDGLVDTPTDADGDGFADVYDTDDDGTAGVEDAADALLQTDGTDTDGDGKADDAAIVYENGENVNADSDGDGLPDHLDLDADNDGIPDLVEAGGVDSNGDGLVDTPTDADGDGFADVYDTDDDGTAGVEDAADALLQTDGTDTDGDGKADDAAIVYENGENVNADSDGDGLPDHLDLDADNDGIPDLVEAGGIDTDGNGRVDTTTDADGDGFADIYDTDDDGTPGVEDATDALVQTGGTDTDGDGKADDAAITYVDGNSNSKDTDSDGLSDYLDLDADNDGIPDLIEAGGTDPEGDGMVDTGAAPWDADGDGLADHYDTNASDGPAGSGTNGTALVQTTADTNADGKVNAATEEMTGGSGNNVNNDGDAVANHLDLDADNDGIVDVIEAGGTDANGDGILDGGTYGTNGYNNTVDPADGASPLIIAGVDTGGDTDIRPEYSVGGASGAVADTDGDDVPDFLDVDADNDGIYDNYEAQTTAGYIAPGVTDTDGDGILNAYDDIVGFGGTGIDENTGTAQGDAYDHDSDGTPDYLDPDSDDDGISDRQEAWDNVYDGDSKEDNLGGISCTTGVDADGDGLLECYDNDDGSISDISWAGAPADDDGTTDSGQTASTGTVFGVGSSLDALLPDNGSNGGTNPAEPDFRDVLIADCNVPQVYYAISEQEAGTSTDYEFDPSTLYHVDGSGSGIVRASAYCEPGADGYHYYYNPLEPDNYLFAIKNSSGSPNTIPFDELIDYIEIKVEANPTNRHAIGQAVEATLVMERDWNVVFKGSPTSGSTFDVKFYFRTEEMATLDAAADAVMATANGASRSSLQWFKKPGGLSNSDIDSSGVANMTDITSFDMGNVDETNSNAPDGDGNSVGNGKNYVEFTGLSSFSGGTAMIKITYTSLPVELSRFDGKVSGCNTMLTWFAQTEENFSHYQLEWSGDGQHFQPITRIEGKGSTTLGQAYQYFDEKASVHNYYRLKMVDEDGSYEYSKVIYLQTNCDDEYDLTVYPNPLDKTNQVLNIKIFREREDTELVITNILGRTLLRTRVNTQQEWNTIRLDVSHLPVGTYFVKQSGSRSAVRFVIKE